MRGPKRRRGRRILGLLLLPPAFWAAVLFLMPTDWARRRIERELAAITGAEVRLQALRIGPLGGIRLNGLTIADPEAAEGPGRWFEAETIRIDLSLAELIVGRTRPRRVEADGLTLRLIVEEDGRFAPADALRRSDSDSGAEGAETETFSDVRADDEPIDFQIERGRIVYVDQPNATAVSVADVVCRGTWWPVVLEVKELRGTTGEGTVALAFEVERGPQPAFAARIAAEGVRLNGRAGALRYFVPYLAGTEERLDGRLRLDLELKGHGASGDALRDSITGRGVVAIDPIRLDGSRLLSDLAHLVPAAEATRVGALWGEFQIERRLVWATKLTLKLADAPIVLSGCTHFDGRLHYRLHPAPLAGRFGPDGLELLAQLGLELEDLLDMRIQGSMQAPRLTVAGRSFENRAEAQEALEALSRRLRSRILR